MESLRRIPQYIIFLLLQVWIANKFNIFGYATLFIYVYPLLHISAHTSRNSRLWQAFLYGIVLDMFSNTPGMYAAATTALMFVQPYILRLFPSPADGDDYRPSIAVMHYLGYIFYCVLSMLLLCSVLFIVQSFFGSSLLPLLYRIGSSALLTVIVLFLIEILRKDAKQHKK